jgi:thiol-disulfide isomerase/thioredoxin
MRRMLIAISALIIAVIMAACFRIDKSQLSTPLSKSMFTPTSQIEPTPTLSLSAVLPTLTWEEEKIVAGLTVRDFFDFIVTDINGVLFDSSKLRGKVLVINFWATWCGPCVAEIPEIQKVYPNFGEDVFFIAIDSFEDASVPKDKVIEFVDSEKITFPVAYDSSGQIGKEFNVKSIPTTFIIDPKGRTLFLWVGKIDKGENLLNVIDNVRKYYQYVK